MLYTLLKYYCAEMLMGSLTLSEACPWRRDVIATGSHHPDQGHWREARWREQLVTMPAPGLCDPHLQQQWRYTDTC